VPLQYTTIYHNILQYTAIYHDIPQYTAIYHDIPQYTAIYHDIPQYTAIHHAINTFGSQIPCWEQNLFSHSVRNALLREFTGFGTDVA